MAKNYFGITDVGRRRDNNEDAFIVQQVMQKGFVAACVIDGVGGYEGGEVAARLAQETILRRMEQLPENPTSFLKQTLAAVHEAVVAERKTNAHNNQMACVLTLALADMEHNKFYYAHVGDTRLYLLRDGTLIKITHDHSFTGMLEDTGRISEEAAMKHPKRHEINRAVGFESFSEREDYIETGESPFLPGDVLLLCSDGLSDMVDSTTIINILSTNESLSAKAKALIDAANEAGGKDNITAVLVHNDKAPLKFKPTMPAYSGHGADAAGARVVTAKHSTGAVKNKKSGIGMVLMVLCLLILIAAAWLLYQEHLNKQMHERETKSQLVERRHNEKEQLLADSIERTATHEVFVVNPSGAEPVLITDSISIKKDTLHIIGNGVTLTGDSVYKGPVFILSPLCKYILLDSITFQNLEIGIATLNKALHLKNVQFKNCRIPVQYNLLFPDQSFISGRLTDSFFFQPSQTVTPQ